MELLKPRSVANIQVSSVETTLSKRRVLFIQLIGSGMCSHPTLKLIIRIILDEAHNIKERSTNAAKAAFALTASFRWCLSGTPLQNRVGELYSLVRFLGADPFSFYFCKKCPVRQYLPRPAQLTPPVQGSPLEGSSLSVCALS